MRFVLAIVAALANAAGPWMCCCAVGAMLNSPRDAKGDVPEALNSCTHCCRTATVSTDESPSFPAKPVPTQPNPCQERQLSIPSTALEISLVDAIALEFAIAAPFATPVLELIPTALRENERPFYPPDTRQRVHHVLHC